MASKRGRLIVVEGLDRAGKSTQVERLVAYISNELGHKVEQVRFPDRSTPIGQSINAYLKGESEINDQVIHLLFSANRWEAAEKLKAKLNAGISLVVDRYSFSGAVYSAAKGNASLDLDWAWSMEIGLPRPDLVLFLNVSPEVQAARGGFGEERYESSKMQMAVRSTFDVLWKRYDVDRHYVDANGSLEQVEEQLRRLAKQCFALEQKRPETLTALSPLVRN